MSNPLLVTNSPIYQSQDESLIYAFEWSAQGTPAAAGTVKLYDKQSNISLGTANLSGSPSLNGTQINTPYVFGLTASKEYILVCIASVNGSQRVLQCEIKATP